MAKTVKKKVVNKPKVKTVVQDVTASKGITITAIPSVETRLAKLEERFNKAIDLISKSKSVKDV